MIWLTCRAQLLVPTGGGRNLSALCCRARSTHTQPPTPIHLGRPPMSRLWASTAAEPRRILTARRLEMWPRRFAWLHLDFSCRCAAQLLRMIESPEGASTQLDPCCACETIWRKGGPCCWQHRIDGQPDPRRAQLGQQFREEHNVPEHQPWRPPSPTLPPPAEVLPPPRKQRAPCGKLHQRVLQGAPLIKGHIAEPRPQEGKGGHVVGAEIDRSLRRSRSVAPTRYSPPQEKTNNSRPASTASEHMRQSARARFHAVKSHVAECLVSAGLDAFKACPWAEGLEAVAIHHGHRAEWTTLFTQPQMVCGGPFNSGMVGGGHHTVLNMRLLAKNEDYSERTALIENVEMDHSLQPVIRTCRLWVQTVGLRGAQWFDNVSVDLLVHCIYSVRARTIKDKQYPPAVIPRCRSCHSTWHESHGTIVQLAEHTT